MKKVVIFVAIATILAVSGFGYTFIASETSRKSIENLNAKIQGVNSDLTSLQNRLTTLNSSLTQLSESLGNLDADLQREIVSIQANVSSLATQISNVKNNVTAIQKDITNIQTDITTLKSNVTSLSTQISDVQKDISAIQTLTSDLQSKVASLETRVSTLEAEKSIVIRINFVSFVPDATPPGGEDYLFDAEAEGPGVYAQARTGHSRFIKPRYLDLVIRNGTQFMGTQVTIKLYAYWHLSDTLIDINGDTADYHLVRTYKIGTIFQGTVDGNNDGRSIILDPYDAIMTYKIETLP